MMATEKRLIDARHLTSQMYLICEACQTENIFIDTIIDEIDNAPDVDAVEVVCCKNCINGIYDEANNIYKCVKSADYDPEYDDWLGFVSYHNADYYCADGERRTNEN